MVGRGQEGLGAGGAGGGHQLGELHLRRQAVHHLRPRADAGLVVELDGEQLQYLRQAQALAEQVVDRGAGAAGVAALMDTPRAFEPPVVVVLSGGNIDPVLLLRVLRHGMAAAGRYLSFRLRIPDRPGELAHLLGTLAESGANVLDVEHVRTGPKLHLDEVEVALQLETRGPDHCDEVLSRLRAAGYPLVFH